MLAIIEFCVGKRYYFTRKLASGEASCVGAIHAVDDLTNPGILATMISDLMEARLIYQSVVVEILSCSVGGLIVRLHIRLSMAM